MSRIVVVGSLAYDRIMNFPGLFRDHFLPGELHNINVAFSVGAPKEEFGGCAGNIAYNLALLGSSPEIISTAGNDFSRYEEWLRSEGIATTSIEVSGDMPSASAYIVTDEGDNQITAFSTAADGKPYTLTLETDNVALAIVSPTGTEKMRDFARLLKDAGVPVIFDPGQQISSLSEDELRDAIDGSHALIVNDYELALVVEKTGWNEAELVSRAATLVVTLGEHGSRVFTKDEAIEIAGVPASSVVDPTGAGDAYRAGFMHGIVSGLALKESAQLGSAVAVYAVECYGTQNHRFSLDELKERYEAAYRTDFPL